MRFQCPQCNEIVAVDNSAAGKTVQCGRCQKVVPVPESRTAPGALIADFIIKSELGRGGMGVVYLSHQISLDREAALKVLSATYASNTDFVVGFIKEARAAAKLNHPHIVQAYAVGEDEGLYYFAMENINGKTMKQILEKQKVISVDDAVLIIQQIAEALDYAWKEQRLIHRDIKPDNIMLTKNGKAKLADLGLARVAGEKDDMEKDDEVMGTPQYISPEALLGNPMDVRSDIYSLGATFYQFVTGQFPFSGNSASEIAKKHITDQLVPPIKINPQLPEAVSTVIVKMMEKDPNKRYQDAELLVEDLRNIRKYKTTTSGRMPRLTIPTTSSPMLKMTTSSKVNKPQLERKGLSLPSKQDSKPPQSLDLKPAAPVLKKPEKPEEPTPQPPPQEKKEETPPREKSKKASKQVKGMKAERERKAIGKLLGMIIGAILLIALIGGGIWFVATGGDIKKLFTQTFQKVSQTVSTTVEKAQEPSNTPLTGKADDILAYVAGDNVTPEKTVELCEDFFLNFPDPKYTKELEKYAEIQKIFDENDEKLSLPMRQETRERYLKKLDEEREAERRRREDQARQERERKEREEREREQKRIADERRKKETQELNQLKGQIAKMRSKICIDLIDLFAKDDYDGAKQLLDEAIALPQSGRDKSGAWRNEANQFANWARRRLNWLNQANDFRKTLLNGGSELNRPQIVYKDNFGYVTSIKNGVATADKGGGNTFTVNLKDLSPAQYMAFILRLTNKMKNSQKAFYYLVLHGDFDPHEDLANPNLKRERDEIGTDYFREKYRVSNKAQKDEMIKTYGKLELFKKATGVKR